MAVEKITTNEKDYHKCVLWTLYRLYYRGYVDTNSKPSVAADHHLEGTGIVQQLDETGGFIATHMKKKNI